MMHYIQKLFQYSKKNQIISLILYWSSKIHSLLLYIVWNPICFIKEGWDFSKMAMRGWKSFARNGEKPWMWDGFVMGGSEIFKVSITFLSYENYMFWLKNSCYTFPYKKTNNFDFLRFNAFNFQLTLSIKYTNSVRKENYFFLMIYTVTPLQLGGGGG